MFNNYALVQGADKFLPVDVYVPGCPPRPGGADVRDQQAPEEDLGPARPGLARALQGGGHRGAGPSPRAPLPDATGLELVAQRVRDTLGDDAVAGTAYHRELATLEVAPGAVHDVLAYLKDEDEEPYPLLMSLHGCDYLPEEPRFGVHYQLLSMERTERLSVKTRVGVDDADGADRRRPLPRRQLPRARGLRHVRRRLRRPPRTCAASSCRRTTRATRSGATSRSAASPCSSPTTRTRCRAGMSETPTPLRRPLPRARAVDHARARLERPSGRASRTELFTINMGPHHPATHGVLRLLLTLEGENVLEMEPIIGYVHTGHREVVRGPGLLEGHPVRRADGLPLVLLQRDGVLHVGRAAARRRGAAARAVPARRSTSS